MFSRSSATSQEVTARTVASREQLDGGTKRKEEEEEKKKKRERREKEKPTNQLQFDYRGQAWRAPGKETEEAALK